MAFFHLKLTFAEIKGVGFPSFMYGVTVYDYAKSVIIVVNHIESFVTVGDVCPFDSGGEVGEVDTGSEHCVSAVVKLDG